MHELDITRDIIEFVTDRAAGARIARVVIEVGKLSAVLPTPSGSASTSAPEGTPAEGAILEILEPSGLARCRACSAEFALDRPFGRCECGGTDLDWLAGEGLTIKALELA